LVFPLCGICFTQNKLLIMRCPSCHGQTFTIEVVFRGFVTAVFRNSDEFEVTEPVSMQSSWTDDSPCICETCHWEGRVADAVGESKKQDQDSVDE
jgi:hypothetical protein